MTKWLRVGYLAVEKDRRGLTELDWHYPESFAARWLPGLSRTARYDIEVRELWVRSPTPGDPMFDYVAGFVDDLQLHVERLGSWASPGKLPTARVERYDVAVIDPESGLIATAAEVEDTPVERHLDRDRLRGVDTMPEAVQLLADIGHAVDAANDLPLDDTFLWLVAAWCRSSSDHADDSRWQARIDDLLPIADGIGIEVWAIAAGPYWVEFALSTPDRTVRANGWLLPEGVEINAWLGNRDQPTWSKDGTTSETLTDALRYMRGLSTVLDDRRRWVRRRRPPRAVGGALWCAFGPPD